MRDENIRRNLSALYVKKKEISNAFEPLVVKPKVLLKHSEYLYPARKLIFCPFYPLSVCLDEHTKRQMLYVL